MNAADDTGPGEAIPLGRVRRDGAAKFRLQEKYKRIFFVDKDVDGENGYYENADADPLPVAEWENRKIMGLVWENHKGWRLESKLCNDLTGPSANYVINPCMIRMIKESNRNRLVRFRSIL